MNTITAELAEDIYTLNTTADVVERTLATQGNRDAFDSIYGEGTADTILEKWLPAYEQPAADEQTVAITAAVVRSVYGNGETGLQRFSKAESKRAFNISHGRGMAAKVIDLWKLPKPWQPS